MRKPFSIYLIILLAIFGSSAKAVDYSLPDTGGNLQSLDQYLGKWVVINYWATWCATCWLEIPHLKALHDEYSTKDIVVVGVNFESITSTRLAQFVADHAISYPVWRSEPTPITPIGKVPALPVTYIVDPKGNVVAAELGMVTEQNLLDYIAHKRPQYQDSQDTDNKR